MQTSFALFPHLYLRMHTRPSRTRESYKTREHIYSSANRKKNLCAHSWVGFFDFQEFFHVPLGIYRDCSLQEERKEGEYLVVRENPVGRKGVLVEFLNFFSLGV